MGDDRYRSNQLQNQRYDNLSRRGYPTFTPSASTGSRSLPTIPANYRNEVPAYVSSDKKDDIPLALKIFGGIGAVILGFKGAQAYDKAKKRRQTETL